jgi:hypothetical protein
MVQQTEKKVIYCPMCYSVSRVSEGSQNVYWCGNPGCFVCTFTLKTSTSPAAILSISKGLNPSTSTILVREIHGVFFNKTKSLKVYKVHLENPSRYRFSLALPKELVDPIKDQFESVKCLSYRSWMELDGYRLYQTIIFSENGKIPEDQLNAENTYLRIAYGRAIDLAKEKLQRVEK